MFFEIGSQARDLFVLIFGGNGNQDGLVKAATDEFHLTTLDECSQASEIFGAIFFDPREQRPGVVEAEMNLRVLFEVLDKGEIARIVGFFENMLKIAAGLVRMNEQGEMEFRWHGDRSFALTS